MPNADDFDDKESHEANNAQLGVSATVSNHYDETGVKQEVVKVEEPPINPEIAYAVALAKAQAKGIAKDQKQKNAKCKCLIFWLI